MKDPTNAPTDERHNEFGQPIGRPVDADLPAPPPSSDPMVGRWCRVEALDVATHARGLFGAYGEAPDERAMTYLFHDRWPTIDHFVEWLAYREGGSDPMFFVISDSAGPCGLAALQRIVPDHGVVEVGSIHLAPRLQGATAATEAMYLMMKRVFETGYRRYEWKCDSLNAPSRSAADRLGFVYEGEFRQAIVYKGRNRDTSWFSIVDREWPALRPEFERWLDPANFDEAGRQLSSLRHRT